MGPGPHPGTPDIGLEKAEGVWVGRLVCAQWMGYRSSPVPHEEPRNEAAIGMDAQKVDDAWTREGCMYVLYHKFVSSG